MQALRVSIDGPSGIKRPMIHFERSFDYEVIRAIITLFVVMRFISWRVERFFNVPTILQSSSKRRIGNLQSCRPFGNGRHDEITCKNAIPVGQFLWTTAFISPASHRLFDRPFSTSESRTQSCVRNTQFFGPFNNTESLPCISDESRRSPIARLHSGSRPAHIASPVMVIHIDAIHANQSSRWLRSKYGIKTLKRSQLRKDANAPISVMPPLLIRCRARITSGYHPSPSPVFRGSGHAMRWSSHVTPLFLRDSNMENGISGIV